MEQVVTKVLIGGREYPIRVNKSEEQSVLKAVKLINDRLSQYEKTYTGSDKFDHLAMCAIQLATELTALESRGNVFKQEVNQKVEELDQMLTGYLSA
ncbi:MAG: cell division protein ZapA [Bacteroidia bacterium]